jgi:hypothetical protein
MRRANQNAGTKAAASDALMHSAWATRLQERNAESRRCLGLHTIGLEVLHEAR